jgi:hypothetical protein
MLVGEAKRREHAIGGIWLRQKLTIYWHLLPPRRFFSGGNDNLYRRPAVVYRGSQPEAVHGPGHVYIGYEDANVVARLQDFNRLIGIGRRPAVPADLAHLSAPEGLPNLARPSARSLPQVQAPPDRL